MNDEPAGVAAIGRLDLDDLRAKLAAASAGPPGPGPAGPYAPDGGPHAPERGPLQPLGLRRVVEGPGALDQLGDVLAAASGGTSGPVVVLAAATPMSVRGKGLRQTIGKLIGGRSGFTWVVIGPGSGAVHADEPTVAAARAAAAGAGCVVTVGSGTITDVGKAAAGPGIPLVAVQTATSVNGYADPFSVLLRDGVKRTTPTRWPDTLVIDPDVLCGAPAGLNLAGAGDLAAMFALPRRGGRPGPAARRPDVRAGRRAGRQRPDRERPGGEPRGRGGPPAG
jgi:hypothetical protein